MKRQATGVTAFAMLLFAALLLVALPSTALGSGSHSVTATRSASNTQTYQDSTGENPAAPDITSITVT